MQFAYDRKTFGWCVAVAGLGLSVAPSAARAAATVVYRVSFNDTTALANDAADRSYALLLELTSGGTPGVTNTVTAYDFNFGTGGRPDGGASIDTAGDVSAGSGLSGSVTLDSNTTTPSVFAQDFTPGGTLTFLVSTTDNGVDPTVNTPDELSVQLLDDASGVDSFTGFNVVTRAPESPEGMSFATFTYAGSSLVTASYASDPSQLTPNNVSLGIPVPSITSVVPEPAATGAIALAAVCVVRRRARVSR